MRTSPATVALLGLTLLTGACVSNYHVEVEEPATGADAHIAVSKSKDGNRAVSVEIEHLPPAGRLNKKSSGYVVWLTPEDHAPIKAGILDYSEKKRRGRLSATTPYQHFDVTVTIEKNVNVPAPEGKPIVSQRVKSKR